MVEIRLDDCTPQPLACYLKSLGVLRLVGEQLDHKVRGAWRQDVFCLFTSVSRQELAEFFLNDYQPTPVIAPWNGSSGFFPKDSQEAICGIEKSEAARFCAFRQAISVSRQLLGELGLSEKPVPEDKVRLLELCRARWDDGVLGWVDTACVLAASGTKFPPLLGTGGNDGHLEFSNNFMQRLLSLFDPATGLARESARRWLMGSLFSDNAATGIRAPIGQFSPSAVGGPNSTSGFEGVSLVNPWDYVLMIEGAALFAGAAATRLDLAEGGILTAPFTVRAVGVGYSSAAASDEAQARAEIWMPLWGTPASLAEIRALLSEGRAQIGSRPAKDGVDFARAAASLGVDRGIDHFERYSFQMRYGKTYLATPAGRFRVERRPEVDLLNQLDGWLSRVRSKARGTAPNSVIRAFRAVDEAIIRLCQRGGRGPQLELLLALGQAEKQLAGSLKWSREKFIHPIPPLSPEWLTRCNDGSLEFRLAASLASLSGRYSTPGAGETSLTLRCHLEQVHSWVKGGSLRVDWKKEPGRDVVWHDGNPMRSLNLVMARRLLRSSQSGHDSYQDRGRVPARLGDLTAFLESRIDLARFTRLLWGMVLLDWPALRTDPFRGETPFGGIFPGGAYALLKLCFAGAAADEFKVPISEPVHRLAASGQGSRAVEFAVRRLRANGLTTGVSSIHLEEQASRRLAASLLFPLASGQLKVLINRVRPVWMDENLAHTGETHGSQSLE